MSSTPIDAKLIKGLKFTTSEAKETQGDGGKKKTKHFPVERSLTPDDVLDWKDLGDTVVIVAKDGQKHRVAKEPAPGPKEKGKGGGANAS